MCDADAAGNRDVQGQAVFRQVGFCESTELGDKPLPVKWHAGAAEHVRQENRITRRVILPAGRSKFCCVECLFPSGHGLWCAPSQVARGRNCVRNAAKNLCVAKVQTFNGAVVRFNDDGCIAAAQKH